jgi:SP family general alpha glucoside:H+ symporter-like MFS transporter
MALGMANPVGSMLGVLLNGYLTDRLGHKKVFLGAMAFLTGFIFITFFAPNIEVLFIGQLLCGLPWGYVLSLLLTKSADRH